MARRTPNLDEGLFPKIPLRYKEVPLTNGGGDSLVACQHCQGQGAIAKATKTIEEHNKAPVEQVNRIAPSEASRWRKKVFAVTVEDCQPCNGAGLIVNN